MCWLLEKLTGIMPTSTPHVTRECCLLPDSQRCNDQAFRSIGMNEKPVVSLAPLGRCGYDLLALASGFGGLAIDILAWEWLAG